LTSINQRLQLQRQKDHELICDLFLLELTVYSTIS